MIRAEAVIWIREDGPNAEGRPHYTFGLSCGDVVGGSLAEGSPPWLGMPAVCPANLPGVEFTCFRDRPTPCVKQQA